MASSKKEYSVFPVAVVVLVEALDDEVLVVDAESSLVLDWPSVICDDGLACGEDEMETIVGLLPGLDLVVTNDITGVHGPNEYRIDSKSPTDPCE